MYVCNMLLKIKRIKHIISNFQNNYQLIKNNTKSKNIAIQKHVSESVKSRKTLNIYS